MEQWWPVQEILGLNPGWHRINFQCQRNCEKIPKLSAINHIRKFHNIPLSIRMSVQHSVINNGKLFKTVLPEAIKSRRRTVVL